MPMGSSGAVSATAPFPWSRERSPAPAGRARGFGRHRKPSLGKFEGLAQCRVKLPFLGAALFVFRDFMERVDIVWAPLVRGVGIDARTTQSPAHRGASLECFTG